MDSTKVAFSIDAGMKRSIEELKRERYYNKSYAELYRDLINIALERIEMET